MQGCDPDESDDEWQEYIERHYGEIAFLPPVLPVDVDVADVDLVAVMQQTFGLWDDLRENVAAAEEAAAMNGQRQGDGDVWDDETDRDDDEDLPWGDPDAMDRAAAAEYDSIQEHARVPLFESSQITCLQAVVLMLNMFRCNKASNVQIDQAFALAHRVLLPQPNTLPDSEYEASLLLRRLGLDFQSMEVCPNNCVIFRGPFSALELCPNCRSMRRRRHGNSWVPQKILRHFPLEPKLKRIFRSPLQAATMTWHARPRLADGLVRHVSQSKHMEDIRRKEPEFCADARRLFLALITDGMNPFSEKRSTYSMWPVILQNYNVPPWMTTKSYFILLSILILGPKGPSGDDFDTLIEPLVEELLELWMHGVMMQDAARWKNEHHFLMKVMIIFCIHDLPAYGLAAGCVTKGYNGCPVCGPNTLSRRSEFLRKNVYEHQARLHLHGDHPMRTNRRDFRGQVELRMAPPRMTADEVIFHAEKRQQWLDDGGVPGGDDDPVHESGIKRKSILFRLPYWRVISVSTPYYNATCNFVVFLYGMKDLVLSQSLC